MQHLQGHAAQLPGPEPALRRPEPDGAGPLLRPGHRQHDHRKPGELQAGLDRGAGLVVEDALVPAGALEDQLAGEEHRAREAQRDLAAQVIELADRLGADRDMAFQIMNYHLRELVNQIYGRDEVSEQPLEHVIEYSAIVRTEKVHE